MREEPDMRLIRAIAVLPLFAWASAADAGFSKAPSASRAGGTVVVEFAVAARTDVEVAVVDGKGAVVRHLAAGVLGGSSPPPAPLAAGLAQRLEWDGTDDYGQQVAGASVRVRTGMGAKLENIVGGDPYAFWSKQSAAVLDHAQWKVTGLELKSDGKVYLIGAETSFGLPALRCYDLRGNFLKTVFPPAASKPLDEVKGFGALARADGTWVLPPNYGWNTRLSNWGLMSGGLDYGSIWCARFLATPDAGTLRLGQPIGEGGQCVTIGSDGTLREFKPEAMFAGEPFPKSGCFDGLRSVVSPDGKSLYLSGLGTEADGFWRDGQVWKVDLATRIPAPFFALSADERKDRSAIGNGTGAPYTAFHGLAVDAAGNVFVCDRQSKRLAVVGKDGKLIRSIPVENPDAVAVSPTGKALYVTTRWTKWGAAGGLQLLKFNDWSKDTAPAATIPLHANLGLHKALSHLVVGVDKGEVLVWVAYTMLPARIYKDVPAGLELIKDFYESGPKQRALDLQHMEIDRVTGDAYIADSQGVLFRVRDWKAGAFEPCLVDATTRIGASSLAIDSRSRHLYTKFHYKPMIRRWNLDGAFLTPAPDPAAGAAQPSAGNEFMTAGEDMANVKLSLTNGVGPPVTCSWVFTGLWERGMAAGPGGLATIGVVLQNGARIDDYSGPLTYFRRDAAQVPWPGQMIASFSAGAEKGGPNASGVRFDPRGNLYAGQADGKVNAIPAGFEGCKDYRAMGRIYKYAPTGSLASGNLFPTDPAAPAKVYDVHYGPIANPPRFGVDEYGRIYYPDAIQKLVGVIDNEGNALLSFGTYGNRDSLGGLPGDTVPTKGVPLGWPSSVDATDDFIYVSDRLNVRLLRLRKTFTATVSAVIP